MTHFTNTPAVHPEIADARRIRLGAASRPPVAATPVADSGRIRLGAGFRRRPAAG